MSNYYMIVLKNGLIFQVSAEGQENAERIAYCVLKIWPRDVERITPLWRNNE